MQKIQRVMLYMMNSISIVIAGLLQNIVVTYDPDGEGRDYRIISGERRWRAMLLLLEKGNEQFRLVTCQIKQHKTDTEERLNLIMANAFAYGAACDSGRAGYCRSNWNHCSNAYCATVGTCQPHF